MKVVCKQNVKYDNEYQLKDIVWYNYFINENEFQIRIECDFEILRNKCNERR